MLPRLPTNSSQIECKLKYKGHYMYDYVSPDKWLNANNPLYADVDVNESGLMNVKLMTVTGSKV